MNVGEKKPGFLRFRSLQDKPEIDSLAPIVSENAFSGVLGPSGHFFIERTMQVLDGSDFYFFNFRHFSCFEPTYFGTLSEI